MYRQMWFEKRAAPPTFLRWRQLFIFPLYYACMKQILTKEDIPLDIHFQNLCSVKEKSLRFVLKRKHT